MSMPEQPMTKPACPGQADQHAQQHNPRAGRRARCESPKATACTNLGIVNPRVKEVTEI
jgi:hypothetical protein